MSTIFGIFYRDGRPVEHELEAMYSGMAHFPHERHSLLARGNVGFGQMLTFNTPEAVGEAMPRYIPEAKLLFAAEGRIDNRGELFEALGVPGGERTAMPDGDLILQAYLKWGEACVNRLLGKFSFAAFHTGDQRMFLARDIGDGTALNYYCDDKVFAFATSPKGLFPLPFVSMEPDGQMIAKLLMGLGNYGEKTFFRDIHLLPASRVLNITRENRILRRYHDFLHVSVREGLKLEDCCENLLENFQRAVKARLRSCKPVAATLSGGLDSTSVSAVAAAQLAKEGRSLRTYTHVPHFSPSSAISKNKFPDERPFAQAVADYSGNIDPVYLDSAAISPVAGVRWCLEECGMAVGTAGNAFWLMDIITTARRNGCGTLLMGLFGNNSISWRGVPDALPLSEIWKRRGWKGALRAKVVSPLFHGDNPMGSLRRRVFLAGRPWGELSLATKEYEKATLDVEEIEAGLLGIPRHLPGANALHRAAVEARFGQHYPSPYQGLATGIDVRDPTEDPRVVESALAIPNRMFFGERDKWILRTMMKGRLPDEVRLNPMRGSQPADLTARMAAFSGEIEPILDDMERRPGFGEIADLGKTRAWWQEIKMHPERVIANKAHGILRVVEAFLLLRR